MKEHSIGVYIAILCGTACSAPGVVRAQAAEPAAPATLVLPVVMYSGASYPSMRPEVMIEVNLNGGGKLAGAALVDEVQIAEAAGWKCRDASSYQVINQTTKKTVPISAVLPVGREACDDKPIPASVLLVLDGHFDTATAFVTSLVGLPAGATATSAASKFSSATSATAVSIVPQAAPGESLADGKTRDVGQITISYGVPFVRNSPVFFEYEGPVLDRREGLQERVFSDRRRGIRTAEALVLAGPVERDGAGQPGGYIRIGGE